MTEGDINLILEKSLASNAFKLSSSIWSKCSLNQLPKISGYYFVQYFNPEQNNVFYKSIWYDVDKESWVPWRNGVKGLRVFRYIPATYHEYYIPYLWNLQKIY